MATGRLHKGEETESETETETETRIETETETEIETETETQTEKAADTRGLGTSLRNAPGRSLPVLVLLVLVLAQVPVAAAHETTSAGGVSQWHGLLLVGVGVAVVGSAAGFYRVERVSSRVAIYGALAGIATTALGGMLFKGLSPDPAYPASSMPIPRSWYPLVALSVGALVAVLSLVVGRLRWPTRPRYAYLGLLLGSWIAYPALVPGSAGDTHPLGYAIVLGTPLLVGHIVRKDAGAALRAILRDPVARRFGTGVGAVVALFFTAATGYLSLFPDGGRPEAGSVLVHSATYQLVTWPVLEVHPPYLPLAAAISPGHLIVVGLLSGLVGLNATVVAGYWRAGERIGLTGGSAGTATVVGACTCGCCGPVAAEIALLAAGPSVAAPLYWLFVDTASPLGAVFVAGAIVLFTGSLVYSVGSTRSGSRW